MKTIINFDGYSLKSEIIDSGSNYNLSVRLFKGKELQALTMFKHDEKIQTIVQWGFDVITNWNKVSDIDGLSDYIKNNGKL